MGRLSRERELLDSAVSYALTEAALVTPQLLSSPTLCPGWDLEMLLNHVVDSIRVLHEAITIGGVSAGVAPDDAVRPRLDPVAGLRRETAKLLAAGAAPGSAEGTVYIGDRELTASVVTVAGAIEIAVHGVGHLGRLRRRPSDPVQPGGSATADCPVTHHRGNPIGPVRRPGSASSSGLPR